MSAFPEKETAHHHAIKQAEKRAYKEGIEEGIEEGKKTMAFAMISNGLTPQQVAGLTNHSLEEVCDWLGIPEGEDPVDWGY